MSQGRFADATEFTLDELRQRRDHLPLASAGADQTATVGTTIHLDGTGSSDPDGNPLTFAWTITSRPAGSTAALVGATTATPSLTIDRAGTYTVELTVGDGTLTSAPDTVLVSTSNSAPVANGGPDQSGQVGSVIALDGSGSTDVDGDLLTYRWVLTSRPAGSTAALDDPTAVTPTFTIDVFGDYTAGLVVNDGTVDSAPDAVAISMAVGRRTWMGTRSRTGGRSRRGPPAARQPSKARRQPSRCSPSTARVRTWPSSSSTTGRPTACPQPFRSRRSTRGRWRTRGPIRPRRAASLSGS